MGKALAGDASYSWHLSKTNVMLGQVDMETARNKELQFFRANPRYADLKNIGMKFLSDKLSNHLIGAIRRQLPAIQNQINTGQLLRLTLPMLAAAHIQQQT